MSKRAFLLFTLCVVTLTSKAQYAPQATLPGSTAIHKTDPSIKAWATQCRIQRGFQDIAQPTLGYTTIGDSTSAIGIADGNIVSLGDSGVAIVSFAQPITNGAGYDFAVFENGFANPQNPAEAYLELATVAVSSDGQNFYTLPPHSLTPLDTQIAGTGRYMNAAWLNNLAGKYIGSYGTPFDLQDLAHISSINLQHITHIKITDVVGALRSAHSTKDTAGNFINDPYPTPFPTGGFDLDAVGVIHQSANSIEPKSANNPITLTPNPALDIITLHGAYKHLEVMITDNKGTVLWHKTIRSNEQISINALPSGVYFMKAKKDQQQQWQWRFIKY